MTRVHFLFFLIFLFPAFPAHSGVANDRKAEEVRKIDSLNQAAILLSDTDIEQSLVVAKEAHDRSFKIYYINGEAMSLALIANYYLAKKKYQDALKNFPYPCRQYAGRNPIS